MLNLNFHVFRANYVANMYLNVTRLHMSLDPRIYHGLKEDGLVQWVKISRCFDKLEDDADIDLFD